MCAKLERMKVSFAVDIFSPDTVAALKLYREYGIIGFQHVANLIFLESFRPTRPSLKITSSTVESIQYLLENGFLFVLTREFTSDNIERFFRL